MGNDELMETSIISTKLAAVNNAVRFSILEILKDFEKNNVHDTKKPLYSREINDILFNNYNIEITPQMLGQHFKKLVEAGLIEEKFVKKEVPNKVGLRTVKAYVLKVDAFEDLFLEINFLTDELLSYFGLYKANQTFCDGQHCILTVFNGPDKGKTFKISKDEVVSIGRGTGSDEAESEFSSIILDESYCTVSGIEKPHVKLFYEDGNWCIIDENSSNGTLIADRKVPRGEVAKLKNNSFLKLSRGFGAVIIYCSF